MEKKKRNLKEIYMCYGLISIVIIYTTLIKFIDAKKIGPNGSLVGFSSINNYIFNLTGINMIWYYITDWLGFIPLIIAFIYMIIGLIQLIKRKNILKVDKEILGVGVFYLIVISIYIFFENIVINYRPILIDGVLEASYPSSHTLLSICICGSSLMINKYLFKNKRFFQIENIISRLSIIIIVLGRLISGVHWFTDIIGAILISITLLNLLNLYFKRLKIINN